MLDNEIKKLLTELKMNDLIDTLEGNAKHEEVVEELQEMHQEVGQEVLQEVLPQEAPIQEELQEPVRDSLQEPLPEEDFEQNIPSYTPEPQYHKEIAPVSYFSGAKVLLAIACATLAPSSYMLWQMPHTEEDDASSLVAYNDFDDDENFEPEELQAEQQVQPELSLQQEREASAASWAREIVEISVEDGKSVHQLWDMLRRRREDLEEITKELSELLSDNAKFRQDFYSQAATVLLSRYQAIDARHSVEIANQINAIYAQIKEEQDPDLTRAYAEMLGELGAESYSTHQIQIAKELLQQESMCQKAVLNIATANSLPELEYNIRLANQVIRVAQTNGLMQAFHGGQEYQDMISQKCREALDKLLVEDACNKEDRALLESILTQIDATESEFQNFTDRFDQLTKPKEVEPTSIHANC